MRRLTWVRPPQQSRSQKTMDRILDAVEELIAEKAWDEVTVREVVERAGTSVGSFYARFADKDALLYGLDERFYAELEATVEQTLAPERWEGASLEEILRTLLNFLAGIFRERSSFHRLITLVPRLRPDPRFRELGKNYRVLIERMGRLLLLRAEEITHPDPERAVRVAFVTAVLMIREAVVFPEGPAALGGGAIVDDMTSLILAYLTGGEQCG